MTLLCEDNQQVEAHRVILSTCSAFFMNVLKKSKHSHPMIYMRGVKPNNLVAIVDFIYNGETNIFQDNLDEFLKLAEELQLKGLAGNFKEDTINEVVTNKPQKTKSNEKRNTEPMSPPVLAKEENQVQDVPSDEYGTVAVSDLNSSKVSNVEELDGQIDSMLQKVDGSGMYTVWACSVCGKQSKQRSNIRQHIEARHTDGISHPCDQCGKVMRSRNSLAKHIIAFHKPQ